MITAADRQLMHLELTRSVRQPLLWIGAVLSILFLTVWGFGTTDRWPAESYTRVVDHSAVPLAAAAFMMGALAVLRDAGSPLAPATAVDVARRTTARLGVVAVPVAAAGGLSIAIAVTARVRGGFGMGEGGWSTESFQPPVVALLQGPLMVAAMGAFGMLTGRLTRSRLACCVTGAVLVLVFMIASWAWQWLPVAPLQYTPFRIDLPNFDASTVPAGWYLETPTQYDRYWGRQVVHVPTIAGHDLYLAGAAILSGALAIGARPTARRVAVLGGLVAIVGIVSQIVTFPR